MGSRGQRSASASVDSKSAGGSVASKIVNDNMKAFDEVDTDGVKEIKHKALTEAIKKYFHEDQDGKGWGEVVDKVKFWEHPIHTGSYFATYENKVIHYAMKYGANVHNARPIVDALKEGRLRQNDSKKLKEIYDFYIAPAVTKKGTGKENFERPEWAKWWKE